MGLDLEYAVKERVPEAVKSISGEIAAGTYTDIVDIIAPSEAAPGDKVSIEVKVKNIWDYPFYIAVTGRYNGVDIAFSPDYANVGAGATHSFASSFTMPNNDVKVDVWSFYWTGSEWYQDDHDYVNIPLKVLEPEFRGFGVSEYNKR